jgi:hypothetical protein
MASRDDGTVSVGEALALLSAIFMPHCNDDFDIMLFCKDTDMFSVCFQRVPHCFSVPLLDQLSTDYYEQFLADLSHQDQVD